MDVRRWVAGVVCLPLLLVSACTDDDAGADPDPSPSSASQSPSNSPSATPTVEDPVPPTLPAAAQGSDDKAARAFARYWIAMVNYAQSTGDTLQLAALHDDGCDACTAGVAAVDEGFAKGGSMVGGRYTIRSVQSVDSNQAGVRLVGVLVRATRQRTLNRRGEVTSTARPGLRAFRLFLRKDGAGEWTVGWLETKTG
ncbi:DUF6318 family protein [Nocardioides jensenii]|uniref:DUF6318 family protein n=1 Tax=Nocardioides jensenii TaxID=1843 RepID=UPI0008334B9B|nr:DUF6318 family protein [Nocardioides jensenii]